MQLISDNIRTRTAIPNNSAAVGFVNSTSIPVWRMLSIGNTIPGSGLADMMIGNYREVIAADYAFTFSQPVRERRDLGPHQAASSER